MAVTFATPREMNLMRLIERVIKHKIAREPIPTMMEARVEKMRVTIEKLLSTAENQDISSYRGPAEGLLQVNDSVTLLSAALKMIDNVQERAPVELTEPRPPGKPPGKVRREGGSQYGTRGPKKYGEKKVGTGFSRRK